jgi:hypothetical protein
MMKTEEERNFDTGYANGGTHGWTRSGPGISLNPVKAGLRDDHHPPGAEAGLKKKGAPFLENSKRLDRAILVAGEA